jgi:hypothetical protein
VPDSIPGFLKSLKIPSLYEARASVNEKTIPPFQVDILWAMSDSFPGVIDTAV